MQRITQSAPWRIRLSVRKAEFSRVTECCSDAEVVELWRQSCSARAVPTMVKRTAVNGSTKGTKRMPVRVPRSTPVQKLDAKFEGRVRMADKVAFVDPQIAQQIDDRRYRRLAYADDTDLRRLNDRDHGTGSGQRTRKHARGEPSGRSPANNRYAADQPPLCFDSHPNVRVNRSRHAAR